MKRIRIGDKIIEIDRIENGVPVICAMAEEIPNANGGQDVVVHVPCLQIDAEPQQPESMEIDPLEKRLTDEFLMTLLMAAERFGWSYEIESFVRNMFEKAGRDISKIPKVFDKPN